MKSVPQMSRRRPVQVVEEEEEDDEFDEEFSDEEFEEDGEEDEDDNEDIGDLMVELLSHEDDNVCSAMLKVAKQLETTNRLLVKMLASNTPQASPSPVKRPRSRRALNGSASSSEVEPEAVDLTVDDDESVEGEE
jgi:hypothetical protein